MLKHALLTAAALAAAAAHAQSYVTAGGAPVRAGRGGYLQVGERAAAPAVARRYNAEVLFGFDDDVLSAQARKALDSLAHRLSAIEVDQVVAVGYADAVGPRPYNKRLSARRAKAVGDYLAGKGVPAERLRLVAMGQDGPQPERRVAIELVGREKAH
jgi:outer membrane protein OmpA-like peptidoglycan-associated protein